MIYTAQEWQAPGKREGKGREEKKRKKKENLYGVTQGVWILSVMFSLIKK